MVKPQKRKIQSIADWPHAVTKRKIRTFLGLVGYYHQLIPHFATLAAPLHDLTLNRLPQHMKWTKEAETAFFTLREALCSEPILAAPDFECPFLLQTDHLRDRPRGSDVPSGEWQGRPEHAHPSLCFALCFYFY